MANPADSYNPLMGLDTFKDMGSPPALVTPKDDPSGGPDGVDQFDPTANMRRSQTYFRTITTVATPPDNGLRLPAGVDNYDPLNLPTPPRVGPLKSPASNPTKGTAGRP